MSPLLGRSPDKAGKKESKLTSLIAIASKRQRSGAERRAERERNVAIVRENNRLPRVRRCRRAVRRRQREIPFPQKRATNAIDPFARNRAPRGFALYVP